MSQNNNDDLHTKQRALINSQKPYILRALVQWIEDQGGRPHIGIDTTWPNLRGLPIEHMKNPTLVLNIDLAASHGRMIENGGISIGMRFKTVAHSLWIPMGAILSVFSPELYGVGTSFDLMQEDRPETGEAETATETSKEPEPAAKERPSFLKVVK